MNMFIKDTCGCVYLRVSDDHLFSIKACDYDGPDQYGLYLSKRHIKDAIVMSDNEIHSILIELGSLIRDGYRMRTIRQLVTNP